MGIKAGAKIIKRVIDFTVFGFLDNIIGAIAGVIKWAFILSVIFWVFDSVGFQFEERFGRNSVIFPYIENVGPALFRWLSSMIPFIRDLIDSMDKMPGDKTYLTLRSFS